MEINHEDELSEITVKLGETLTLDFSNDHNNDDNVVDLIDDHEKEDGDEDEDEDFEFSFFGGNLESPVSAEEAFQNGQIRPVFPIFGQNVEDSDDLSPAPPVKVFVVSSENDDVAEGPYCVWSPEDESPAEIPAPEMSRKSNSTGFSRLWRMKDLIARSNSDGKDAFVFLTKTKVSKAVVGEEKKSVETEEKKKKKKTVTGSVAAYEALYGKKKGGGKSYLPYRQDLVGLFTNVNGFTRNVHPY